MCFCTSPKMPAGGDPYMRCDHFRYNKERHWPGAQTSTPDDAGPVSTLLGGMASPPASAPCRAWRVGSESPLYSPRHFFSGNRTRT
jgi:hypothetical protein